ncbi:hypothetical protein [Alloactinosynnema sp. L-07]|uniref:DddA-like double-stranded DNA deaminase toxin n=1 Tax=Alloactinosynnema sp. L-07 TaxID=1653480 RepID=UPI00065EFDC8|nr:DddA-like double-stranded DNA deaminase toxin [Alloactinosynnema sp. L-07]CRK60278.1 hypothetical protein [Alloactinosynnema sp. L-07]
MSVRNVASELARVLGDLETLPLTQALDAIDQAQMVIANATRGSPQPEARQAVALMGHAKGQVRQVHQAVAMAKKLIHAYIAQLGIDESGPVQSVATSQPVRSASLTTKREPLTRDEAESVRNTLPPQVPKPNPDGKKTHGKWFDGTGRAIPLASGYDDDAAEAWRLLQSAGMPAIREPASTAHVEMKAAVRARKLGERHTEVVINNVPCRGIYGCDQLLPVLLPEGYSITVHGPNYRRTFTGGIKWLS